MNHVYPKELATLAHKHWSVEINPTKNQEYLNSNQYKDALPNPQILEEILSIAYQASLLREEERPVTFRVILASSDHFSINGTPPTGLHRLEFTETISLSAHELRRLSPAANFRRSLIAVDLDQNNCPHIWGILHSGPRWLHSVLGGRGFVPLVPEVPVINVTGPGRLEICRGLEPVLQLNEGRIVNSAMNVFESKWLQETFAPIRAERLALHNIASAKEKGWGRLDPDLSRIIDQNMLKRIIAAIRAFRHGGTLVIVPPERTPEIFQKNASLSLKYKFMEGEPRARFRTLIISIMNSLAQGTTNSESIIGWKDYAESTDQSIVQLDESIFEMSHLIAAQSTVDGAVVMTKRFELLGFGAQIHSDLSNITHVARALDLEGTRIQMESVDGVGTRHRSAYALCQDLKDALAIVISQDGGVRFVTWQKDQVTYWDHQATFAFASHALT